MRTNFDNQLALLNNELIIMGSLCEEIIALTANALSKSDKLSASRAFPIDEKIDHKERDIEALCLKLLLQQQPVARDLRQISAALKMVTDMERIGDQAADIAEIIRHLDGFSSDNCENIGEMAKAAIKMVTQSIDAFVKRDVSLAKEVVEYDDVVDDYFCRVRDSLIDMITKNPADGKYALDFLMIAKYFERIGDHAVNISEWVVFSVTGVHPGTNA